MSQPAENDRTPHTHGGADAPECTAYGIKCLPAGTPASTVRHEHIWADDFGGGRLCRVCRVRAIPPAENWNPNTAMPDCDWCGECDWCNNLGRVIPPASSDPH